MSTKREWEEWAQRFEGCPKDWAQNLTEAELLVSLSDILELPEGDVKYLVENYAPILEMFTGRRRTVKQRMKWRWFLIREGMRRND